MTTRRNSGRGSGTLDSDERRHSNHLVMKMKIVRWEEKEAAVPGWEETDLQVLLQTDAAAVATNGNVLP